MNQADITEENRDDICFLLNHQFSWENQQREQSACGRGGFSIGSA